jgi:hypothetical protein
VGKATGSRECAPDDKLRVPTIFVTETTMVGTAQARLCPPYESVFAVIASAAKQSSLAQYAGLHRTLRSSQ